MHKNTFRVLPAVVGAVLAGAAATSVLAEPSVEETLAAQLPGLEAENIAPAPIDGLYEIAIGTEVAYISGDGKYLIKGDIIDLSDNRNLTSQRKNVSRAKVLDAVGDDEAIVFSPAEVKHSIWVFTDIDCGYCRKLHREMDQLNGLGVEVRYLFFPRSGQNTPSWAKAENVWCAKDQNDAMTRAKNGENPEAVDCGATPIANQYELGRMVGLRGTPAIVTESGELISGYLPARDLLSRLESAKAFSAAAAAR